MSEASAGKDRRHYRRTRARLGPPRFVLLDEKHRRAAVDALAELLAMALAERRSRLASGEQMEVSSDGEDCRRREHQ